MSSAGGVDRSHIHKLLHRESILIAIACAGDATYVTYAERRVYLIIQEVIIQTHTQLTTTKCRALVFIVDVLRRNAVRISVAVFPWMKMVETKENVVIERIERKVQSN